MKASYALAVSSLDGKRVSLPESHNHGDEEERALAVLCRGMLQVQACSFH